MKRLALDFVVIAALSLVLLLVAAPALTAAAEQAVPAEPADTAEPAPPAAAGGAFTPGTYSAEGQGFGGKVSVTITVDDAGSISAVEIVGDDETMGIGSNAIEQMPDQILAAQGAEVDGVAGATITSGAIKSALADIVSQAASGSAGAAGGAFAPGTYSAEGQGFGGKVSVTITVDAAGSISAVEIIGDDETMGIGSNAIEQMPDQILAAQGAEVDGVSGATITSGAIKSALADIVSQAGA